MIQVNFLNYFLENLLIVTKHELKNRYIHIDFDGQSAKMAL